MTSPPRDPLHEPTAAPTAAPPATHPTAAPPVSAASTRVHVADTVIARIAAYYARQVTGVAALQPGLTQSVARFADRMFGQPPVDPMLSTDGITVDVHDGVARIEVTVVTRLGYSCRAVAEALQQQVTAQVLTHTGFPAVVTVTITDIDLGTAATVTTVAPAAAGQSPLHAVPE